MVFASKGNIMAEGYRAAKASAFAPGGAPCVSSWLTVDQTLISRFAEATLDPDPMHVDPEWAATKGPYGKTLAFGFLTMSLLTYLMHDATRSSWSIEPDEEGYYLNYGFDRMRLVAPVPVDSRIRGRFVTLDSTIDDKGRNRIRFGVEIEIEGHDRPALVGEWLSIWIPPPAR
jgi:acyl dehydratase